MREVILEVRIFVMGWDFCEPDLTQAAPVNMEWPYMKIFVLLFLVKCIKKMGGKKNVKLNEGRILFIYFYFVFMV